MRKRGLEVTICFLLLILAISFVSAITCTDSDGGYEYYRSGYVFGVNSTNQTYNYTDLCTSSTNLKEYSCYGNGPVQNFFTCPYQCTNGACVNQTQNQTQTCTDSDGGLNYYEVGYAQDSDGSLINDGCIEETGLLLTATGVISVTPQGGGNQTQNESCVLSTPFACTDISASSDLDSIYLDVRNGAGQDITIESISISGCNLNNTFLGFPDVLKIGEEKTYTIHCDTDLIAGEIFNSDLTVTYRMGESHEGWLREAICGVDNQATWADYNCPLGCFSALCISNQTQTCGDINGEGHVDILDVIILVNYLFKNGPAPVSMWAANVNGDTAVNVLDVIYLIDYKYKNGPALQCADINQTLQNKMTSSDLTKGMTSSKIESYLSSAQKPKTSVGLFARIKSVFKSVGNVIFG